MIGDSLTTAALQRALDGTWKRGETIAANIANHETPGYKAIKVNFEDELDRAIRRLKRETAFSGKDYMSALESVKTSDVNIHEDWAYSERADGNNVNLEEENVEMAKFQLQYEYLTRQITDTFSRLRYAVREGR
jgi:flagellar basal-body rod protein FlgB